MNSRTNRIQERLELLGAISDDANCLNRAYGTKAHKTSGDLLISWMKNAGLRTYRDTIGNIRGVLSSMNKDAKHFIIGSHYDTVFDAGKYDGPLGILLGLELAQTLSEKKVKLPFNLTIIAFADEEGARFNTAYLGSSSIAGNFDLNWLLRKDDTGSTLQEIIAENGGNSANIIKEYIPMEACLGYFEAHIEQGPVLCEEDLPCCLVSGIASQTRVNIIWTGTSGHAGTYPMNHRNDALCAASEFALVVESLAKQNAESLVATIGKMKVSPNTPNVIPGLVEHTLDLRSIDHNLLSDITGILENLADKISIKRNIALTWAITQTNASVECDTQLKQLLRKAMVRTGIPKIVEIPSGAGHDAVMLSKIAPVCMLFVRCRDGVSHNPLEFTTASDIEKSLLVCDNFMDELIKATKDNV